MSDDTDRERIEAGLSKLRKDREDELTRLRAREAAYVLALNNISGLKPVQRVSGTIDWVQTCGEMRIIAAKALATLDVPDPKEQL